MMFWAFKATLSSLINRLKKELKQVEKSDIPSKRLEILNYILAYDKICYHIYPSISFKKAIVEELCGQNELAWLNFAKFSLCNDTFELTNNMDEVSFSILEYISDQIRLIKQIEPQYQPPLLKIGRVSSEPELITDILQRNRLICGSFLIISIFLLSWFIVGNPFIAIILTAIIIYSIYYFQDKMPCVWRFISAVNFS